MSRLMAAALGGLVMSVDCKPVELQGRDTNRDEGASLTCNALDPNPLIQLDKKGMTWGKVAHDSKLGIDLVGCYGQPAVVGNAGKPECDPYVGDTSCELTLPILCIESDRSPRPNYALTGTTHAMPAEYYRGWAGGRIGLTKPIQGTTLLSLDRANLFCAAALGTGYRMAEFHDGKWILGMGADTYFDDSWPPPSELQSGGWTWYSHGDLSGERRFWVHINDQAANCWGRTDPKALNTADASAEAKMRVPRAKRSGAIASSGSFWTHMFQKYDLPEYTVIDEDHSWGYANFSSSVRFNREPGSRGRRASMVARIRAGMQKDGWTEGQKIPRRRAPSGICPTSAQDLHFHRKSRGRHEDDTWTFQQDVYISPDSGFVCVNSEFISGPDKVFCFADCPGETRTGHLVEK